MARTPDATTILHGDRVELQRLREHDLDAVVAQWSTSPRVRERWPILTRDELQVMLDADEQSDEAVAWLIRVDGELVGMIQQYEQADPEYRHAGIDIYIADRFQGRGYGTDAVRTLARHLVHTLGHHRLIIDPAADNEPAIRCYEAVGFRRVGVMRRYERGGDGSWHDGLLMDLIADELT